MHNTNSGTLAEGNDFLLSPFYWKCLFKACSKNYVNKTSLLSHFYHFLIKCFVLMFYS
jgi:hypothetical protein